MMVEPHGYSIAGYGEMIADRVRTDAYAAALRGAVKPGSVVLDIGAGAGILSLLACRFGAGRVYAVEPDDSIQVARQIAAANGYADRITFIQDVSTQVTLAEQADVVVSDLHGILPLFGHLIPSIIDARERHLAPGGVLIPRQESLWVAAVAAPEAYGALAGPWADRPYDFDMSAARDVAINVWSGERFTAQQLLSEPQCWATLDYATIDQPNVRAELELTVNRAGTGHGLAVWFDSMLAVGIGFSNAPGRPKLIYHQAFFPWTWPVELAAGDSVRVHLDARLIGRDYFWQWDTQFVSTGAGETAQSLFRQSMLQGSVLSLESLRKHEASYAPQLRDDSLVERFALGLMDGHSTLAQIAQRLAENYPDRFESVDAALSYAGDLSEKHSR